MMFQFLTFYSHLNSFKNCFLLHLFELLYIDYLNVNKMVDQLRTKVYICTKKSYLFFTSFAINIAYIKYITVQKHRTIIIIPVNRNNVYYFE